MVPISSLTLDPGNLRRHNEANLESIKASLMRWGQQMPLLVDERGVVIAGNGRLMAARALGWDTVQIVRTSLTGADAVAYGIADNRTAELAEWDVEALHKQFEALAAEDATLALATGFDEQAIADLLEELSNESEPSDGSLLNMAEISLGDPLHKVKAGEVWKAAGHLLFVGSVVKETNAWRGLLEDGMLFCPYPSPDIAYSMIAAEAKMLLVQPDLYLAGHTLDGFESRHGAGSVSRLVP